MNIKEKIINLTNSANSVTGVETDNLTDAMQNLVDGYGGGGGSNSIVIDTLCELSEFVSGDIPLLHPLTDYEVIEASFMWGGGITSIYMTIDDIILFEKIGNRVLDRSGNAVYSVPSPYDHITNISRDGMYLTKIRGFKGSNKPLQIVDLYIDPAMSTQSSAPNKNTFPLTENLNQFDFIVVGNVVNWNYPNFNYFIQPYNNFNDPMIYSAKRSFDFYNNNWGGVKSLYLAQNGEQITTNSNTQIGVIRGVRINY